jgi:hypothetical protein
MVIKSYVTEKHYIRQVRCGIINKSYYIEL